MQTISFSLEPVPPFRLDLTVWTLRRRSDNIVDRWDGLTYRRIVSLANKPVEVAVTQSGSIEKPELQVTLVGERLAGDETRSKVSNILERALGFRIDLSSFYRFAQHDPKFLALVDRFRGMKPPRFPTVFEAVVNGIACQQFSLTYGIHLLNKLAGSYGLGFRRPEATTFSFPRPEDLAAAKMEDLRKMGLTRQKARAMTELSNLIVNKQLDLESLTDLDNKAAAKRLFDLWGVGRWTAEYVLLRGLGRLDVFPGDDVGARNNLEHWLGISEKLTYKSVNELVKPFQPYGGLLYFHLLLNRLAEAGELSP